ncbi:hypothetical protein VIGAN_11159500 [Vigna angularis var. angularis]|uniref:Putative plant transposon protein domain-containing protein n=1 Tax=Vigna angularis var. angularis TaxID=157739 RepID=A0A0S3TAF4_PHAAN|nr:uncharacterized protein LOC108345925 isoform X1 [Vigna angularis]XP_052723215.1 uncharacterized protein LOC108345925 isoform X1 [Vigna angularis]XP_052723216.1 uncharacterized protein LOC108345925 isoform X1 [Vigna angularis]XP_052723217.1 uncharacterized protein LOC108345925 isoform X1 [Vigna angularis]XP_052723218.1 uncharacterized protein LOC108345925 isoform X1 [Vigna angularis]XP_052723219.1 uncharacterized protein LOC108345925 isoform X1 [Vigna angularis]XP_052723220.1 uncharacterize
MASSSTKRPRKSRKGKETLTEAEDVAHVRPSVQEQLDQSRFFTHSHQMENYAADFYTRSIVVPKIMNFESFTGSGLYFQQHLLFQGVVELLTLQGPYYPDLIKVFYSNLKISGNGYLISEVKKKRIRLKPTDWLNVANLKYQGKKLSYSNIPDDFPYDRDMALATMVIPDLEYSHGVLTVGCLNMNDRLLHYVIVHMLTPRRGNFARLLQEDIFMIWVLNNNISINWPHHIMQHMLKCKASDTPLPYGVLITRILQYCGVNVDADACTQVGSRHHFSINSLKRMHIVNVNGVWQHDHVDDEEEDQVDHHEYLVQPPPPPRNPNMMIEMWQGVQDLQHRMQGMEQMQVRVQHIEDNLANLSLDMNRQFANLNHNVNKILHRLDD